MNKNWTIKDQNGKEIARGTKKEMIKTLHSRQMIRHTLTDNIYRPNGYRFA